MNFVLAALALLLLVPLPGVAQVVGTLTLKEGPLRLIRGTTVFQGVEGMRLRPWDILESSEKGLTQVELSGGAVVALGPSTRMLIIGHGSRADQFVILGGWLKGENNPASAGARYVGPQISVAITDATIILHADPGQSELYFESGSGRVSLEGAGPITAKPGQFFSRKWGKKAVIATRPGADFVGDMPISFRDTLPPRIGRFSKAVEPKPDREVSYSDVEAWLRMGSYRKVFEERFRSRLQDAAFRSEVERHLNEFPEWDELLHPEKYEKSAPTAASQNDAPEKR